MVERRVSLDATYVGQLQGDDLSSAMADLPFSSWVAAKTVVLSTPEERAAKFAIGVDKLESVIEGRIPSWKAEYYNALASYASLPEGVLVDIGRAIHVVETNGLRPTPELERLSLE